MRIWISITTILVLFWIIRPFGYVFLLSGPQYATVHDSPKVTIRNISINGQPLPSDDLVWKIRMNEPRNLLLGAKIYRKIIFSFPGLF